MQTVVLPNDIVVEGKCYACCRILKSTQLKGTLQLQFYATDGFLVMCSHCLYRQCVTPTGIRRLSPVEYDEMCAHHNYQLAEQTLEDLHVARGEFG